jgi:hypothetical protein
VTLKIVLPPVSEDHISGGLAYLTEVLSKTLGLSNIQGILGGSYGYGAEFKNDVFEMHPFYYGDCTCGYEELREEFFEAASHEEHCYQSELLRRNPEDPYTGAARLAEERGLPMQGSAIHCDCSHKEAQAKFFKENPDHFNICKLLEPNFRHYGLDYEVSWYKYIGRSMAANKDLDMPQWHNVLEECIASIQELDVCSDSL